MGGVGAGGFWWILHVEKLETKCKKVINLIRAISGINWGADKQALLDTVYTRR